MRKLFLLFFQRCSHNILLQYMAWLVKLMTFILFPLRQLPYLRRFRKKWTIVEEKSLFVFHYMRLRLHRLLFL